MIGSKNILNIYKEVKKAMSHNKERSEGRNTLQPKGQEGNMFVSIPHNLSKYCCIKNLVKKQGKKIATKRLPTVYSELRNEKQPLKMTEKSGVYEIPVRNVKDGECSKYIGVTTRTLEQRITEHKRDISKGKITTALATEAYANDLEINWNRAKVIRHLERNEHKYITETLEILQRQDKESLLNERVVEVSKAWEYAIKK